MEYYISVFTNNNNFYNSLSLISDIPLKIKDNLNEIEDYYCLGVICDQKSYNSLKSINNNINKPILNIINTEKNYEKYLYMIKSILTKENHSYEDLIKLRDDIYFSIEKHCIISSNNMYILTNLEFRLLYCLIKNKNKPCSVEILLNKLDLFSPSSVYVCIKKLRQKIEKDPNFPTILVYEKGKGYYLNI